MAPLKERAKKSIILELEERPGILRSSSRLLCCLPLSLAVALSSSGASALDVLYSGLAFRGNATEVAANYPYTVEFFENERQPGSAQSLVDVAFLEAAKSVTPPNYSLLFEGTLNLEKREGLSLALAIDRESVVIEKIGDDYKIVIDIGGQILIFNYNKKASSIAASFPIAVQMVDVSSGREPDDERIRKRVRELYLGSEEGTPSLIADFREALTRQPVKERYKGRVGVSKVTVSSEAREFLPVRVRENMAGFERSLAQLFSKFLSKNQLLSVVPYSKDGAVGSTMTARFANGEVADFSLPAPDFLIELHLSEFKKILTEEGPSDSAWIFGAYAEVRGLGRFPPKTYMDIPFKQGLPVTVPSTQESIEGWAIFFEAIEELADGLTRELKNKPSKKWLKSHTNDKSAGKQIAKFSKKLEICR